MSPGWALLARFEHRCTIETIEIGTVLEIGARKKDNFVSKQS